MSIGPSYVARSRRRLRQEPAARCCRERVRHRVDVHVLILPPARRPAGWVSLACGWRLPVVEQRAPASIVETRNPRQRVGWWGLDKLNQRRGPTVVEGRSPVSKPPPEASLRNLRVPERPGPRSPSSRSRSGRRLMPAPPSSATPSNCATASCASGSECWPVRCRSGSTPGHRPDEVGGDGRGALRTTSTPADISTDPHTAPTPLAEQQPVAIMAAHGLRHERAAFSTVPVTFDLLVDGVDVEAETGQVEDRAPTHLGSPPCNRPPGRRRLLWSLPGHFSGSSRSSWWAW